MSVTKMLAVMDRLIGRAWSPVPSIPLRRVFGDRRGPVKRVLLVVSYAFLLGVGLYFGGLVHSELRESSSSLVRAMRNGDGFLSSFFALLTLSSAFGCIELILLSFAGQPLRSIIFTSPRVSSARALRRYMTLAIVASILSVSAMKAANAVNLAQERYTMATGAGNHAAWLASRIRRNTAARILADTARGRTAPLPDDGPIAVEIKRQLIVAPRRERIVIAKMLELEASPRVPEPHRPLE